MSRRLLGASAAGIAIAMWLLLAPASVGGDFSYAIVRGDSMAPTLEGGDIVLLRGEARYGLRDVVAYRDPVLGPILHRIVRAEGDRFMLRGDHREYEDAFHPSSDDIIGRSIGRWHGGLPWLLALTTPTVVALVGVAFAAIIVGVRQRSARFYPRGGRAERVRRLTLHDARGSRA